MTAKPPHIYLIGGPGGVGKTTLAATLAIDLAKAGRKTVVLTVDPARRLAQALGFLEGFSMDLQEVMVPGAKGTLHASMLDTSRYFDRIIERYATRPGQREKILKNPLYRVMVDSLGGTHEYAAMERLLEFSNDTRFDAVVVDTPPSQNAVDLLSAPQRLADFMDNSVLRWFQGSRPVFQIFKTGTKLALKVLQKVLGNEFMDNLASFFDELEGMQMGFRERNLEILEKLRSPDSAFYLVTFPSEVRFLESLAFLKTLRDNRIPLAGIWLNRITPIPPATSDAETKPILDYYRAVSQQEQGWILKFKEIASSVPLHEIPRQNAAPHDVESLSALGKFLVS